MSYHFPAVSTRNTCAAHLQRGDVVLFRFPFSEGVRDRGLARLRPCLVLDTKMVKDEPFIEIAYSTTAKIRANLGYEVMVGTPEACEAAGVQKPTRFVCAHRILVHARHHSFDDGSGAGPQIIGHLDAPRLERMNAVRARIQAEADIAAHFRKERRREAAEEVRGLL